MTDDLRITYDVEQVGCDQYFDEVEAFVENGLRGAVTIHFGDRSIRIRPCGLLRVSRSLIRLCTFPVLYGVEANESILDLSIDFRSVYESGDIILEVGTPGKDHEKMRVALPPSDALRIAGDFHKNILLEMFKRCPKLLDENLLLLKVPDAFPLSFLARTGKIGFNVE